ncbi:hypothetical protein [Macrococcus capreoli]|nr:hypothetical protein [Macrococcus sp. TMW 2.2395]
MKKYIVIVISLILCFALGLWLYTYCTTPDNDLSQESLGDVSVNQPFKEIGNDFEIDPKIQLEGKSFYHAKDSKGLVIRKDNKHDRITAIVLFKDNHVYTSRDITIGSAKQEVIDAYGDTYKKSILPKQQTQFHYKDKEDHVGMKFIFKGDKVTRIELFEE